MLFTLQARAVLAESGIAIMKFEMGNQPIGDERLLLNEITHRFNNELAAAIGIVSVAMASSKAGKRRSRNLRYRT
jgi:hypothetical protein